MTASFRPAVVVAGGLVLALFAPLGACSDDGGSSGGSSGASSGSSGASSSGASSSGASSSGDPPIDPTPGCGVPQPKVGFLGSQTITVAGVTRTYELTLPKTYDGKRAYPLVLVFHGDGGDGAGIRSSFDLEAESGDGAIVAYPDGEGASWKLDDVSSATSDIAFVDALIASLEKTYCVEGARVLLTGYSSGAYFVNQAACRTKSKIRGIVTFAGGGPYGVDAAEFDAQGDLQCPAPPVPALQVHGQDDFSVAVTEGHKSRDHWRRVNECQSSTTATDPSPCVAYDGCKRPEVWCLVPGLGHTIWGGGMGEKVTWGFFRSL